MHFETLFSSLTLSTSTAAIITIAAAAVAALQPITITLNIPGVVEAERDKLDKAIEASDLTFIIAQYPVRETGALRVIATKLGFKDQPQYENTVRRLLMDDEEALNLVRSFFGALAADIEAA